MGKISKGAIIEELATKMETTKVSAEKMYDTLMEIVENHIKEEDEVNLYPLGTFSVTTYKNRKFYDYFAKTNKVIPEMKAVQFQSAHFKAFFKEKLGEKAVPIASEPVK